MVEKLATRVVELGSQSFAVMSFEQDTNAPLSLGNQSAAVAEAVCPPFERAPLERGETVNRGCSGVPLHYTPATKSPRLVASV